MKVKVLGVTLLSAAVLFGCAAEGDQESRMGTQGNNYEDSAHNTQYNAQKDGYNNVDYDNGPFNGQMRNGQDYGEENVGNEDTYRNDTGNMNMNMDNNRRYSVADKVADQITEDVKDVKRAYVLKTDRNAYVAVVKKGESTQELNDDMKEKIADAAKKADKDINNVYVSSNPDFFDMTGDYVRDVQNGDPVRGFFQEFGQMVDRIFPDAR